MSAVTRDTWANLPATTLPLHAYRIDTAGRLEVLSSAQVSIPAHAGSESGRWARWGAARDGARVRLARSQALFVVMVVAATLALLYLNPRAVLVAPMAVVTFVYLAAGLYKLHLLLRGEAASRRVVHQETVDDQDLPHYTVLVPMHREGTMLPVLIGRLMALDYPPDRLEVLLLVESDDEETHNAIAACNLPPHIRPITVPRGLPQTKPRALNVGLARAHGEFVVVYDAEDSPEPDQLRKAVAAFRAAPRRIVCLQARLNVYNQRQSLLTRLFTLDYTTWYYALLPGLARPGGFVPLGGTSNHFRIAALRRLGGWDPFNVTEDCDLGVRIARAQLQVAMLDSTTWEEAIPGPRQWIRQRSRWVKGYLQTYLVHMRRPGHLWREMGTTGFLDFQALVGGSVLALLLNPLMWGLTILYPLSHGALTMFIQSLFPLPLYYPGLLCMLVGNFIFFYANLYISVQYGHDDFAPYALLSPVYWVLMSIGAWAGLISLIREPYYWAKTEHGVSLGATSSAAYRAAARAALLAATPTGAPDLSIVIPAYNEAHRLPASLERLQAYIESRATKTEVIVVDDGSTDTTVELVKARMERWPALHLIAAAHKGKGGAIRAGVLAARGDYIAMADADFSMPAAEFDRFSPEELGLFDVAIGSRAVKGAQRLGEPWQRRVLSRGFNLIARTVLVRGIRDTQCGFKCLRREAALDLCRHQSIEGWCFDVELLYVARLRGYRICEVPITWRYIPGSRLKPIGSSLTMLRDLCVIILNSLRGRYAATACVEDESSQPRPEPELATVGISPAQQGAALR